MANIVFTAVLALFAQVMSFSPSRNARVCKLLPIHTLERSSMSNDCCCSLITSTARPKHRRDRYGGLAVTGLDAFELRVARCELNFAKLVAADRSGRQGLPRGRAGAGFAVAFLRSGQRNAITYASLFMATATFTYTGQTISDGSSERLSVPAHVRHPRALECPSYCLSPHGVNVSPL